MYCLPKSESGAATVLSVSFFFPPRSNLPSKLNSGDVYGHSSANRNCRVTNINHRAKADLSLLSFLQQPFFYIKNLSQVGVWKLKFMFFQLHLAASIWDSLAARTITSDSFPASRSFSRDFTERLPLLKLPFVSAAKNFLFILCFFFTAMSFSALRWRHRRRRSVIRRDKT